MTAAACQNITKERKGLGLHSATFSEPNTEGKRFRLETKLKKLKNAANCESQVRGILERTEVCPCARPATPAYARLPGATSGYSARNASLKMEWKILPNITHATTSPSRPKPLC